MDQCEAVMQRVAGRRNHQGRRLAPTAAETGRRGQMETGPGGLPGRMRRARGTSRVTKYNLWQSVPQEGT